jgi:hypothetical protein
MISIPSLAKTASTSRVNLLSRSRMRKRNGGCRSWSVQANWRVCLGDPGARRVGGTAGQVDTSAAELDEEEHRQPLQRDRLDREEVDRERARGLRSQEGTPGQPRTLVDRAESRLAQDLRDRSRRDDDPEPFSWPAIRW